MKIATFNINGIKARVGALSDWLAEFQPDVAPVCRRSSRSTRVSRARIFEDMGYAVETHGPKGLQRGWRSCRSCRSRT